MSGLHGNRSDNTNFTLPADMRFGEAQIISITVYSIMFVIGLTTNLVSLYFLARGNKERRNRMRLLLIHLAVADLLVSFHNNSG